MVMNQCQFNPIHMQARVSGGNGGITKNKYVIFFSCLDENPDIDIELEKLVFHNRKQTVYGSKDYLCN